MNPKLISTRIGSAVVALLATSGLSQHASGALSLVWIDGPSAGNPYTPDAFDGTTWNLTDYDTGTFYKTNANPGGPAVGTAIGFGQGGGAGSVAAGEAALDNPLAVFRPVLNGFGGEDGWGIVKVDQITAIDPTDGLAHKIFDSVASPFELTGLFHGAKDFYLNQLLPASPTSTGQVIAASGMVFSIYSDPAKNFSPDPNNNNNGPGARTVATSYLTATDGTLELSLGSTPGFIRGPGVLGGVATEFESFTSAIGYSALNVLGGSQSAVNLFDTEQVGFGGAYGPGSTDGYVTPRADVWFQFSVTQGVEGWDFVSHDPGTFVAAPEPVSAAAVFGFVAPLLGMAFRRSRVGKSMR